MKIRGTEWYTAVGEKQIEKSSHSESSDETPTMVSIIFYGYRKPVQGKSLAEINTEINELKSKGVEQIKLRTSVHSYTGIPAGTQFLQVLDEKSAIALEKIFLEKGIDLPSDRYKEHGLGYINRTPKVIKPVVKKSIWSCLFGRK